MLIGLVSAFAVFIGVLAFTVVPRLVDNAVDGTALVASSAEGTDELAVESASTEKQSLADRVRAAASPAIGSVADRRAKAMDAVIAQTRKTPKPPKGFDPLTPVGWRLTESRVIAEGTTTKMPQGRLTQGRVIEASAVAKVDGKKVARTFRITLSAFQPSADAPSGLEEGVWYLSGAWQLYPRGQRHDRRSLEVVRGRLSGQYEFNPLTKSERDIAATVDILGAPSGGGAAGRKGEYTGSTAFDGALVLPEGQDLKALASTLTGDK